MKGILSEVGFRRDLLRLDSLLEDLSDRPECIPLFLSAQAEKTKLAKVFVYALGTSSQVIEISEYQAKIKAMLNIFRPFVPESERGRVGELLRLIEQDDYSTAINETRNH